jgi:hypothetical protein
MSYGRDRTIVPVTIDIAVSTTVSLEVNVNGLKIVGIMMPAAWTAANLAISALVDEPSALPKVPVFTAIVDDAHAAIVLATGPVANDYVAIKPVNQLTGLGRIKLVASAGQAANRIVKLVCVAA